MTAFTYFIPGLSAPIETELARRGLGETFGRAAGGRIAVGPFVALDREDAPPRCGGVGGLLLGAPGDALPDDPAALRWVPAGGGDWHLGWDADDPPRARDLQRPQPVAGASVTLGDGGAWYCPTARLAPRRRTLDDEGRPVDAVLDRHRALWEMAREVWTHYHRLSEWMRDRPDLAEGEAAALDGAMSRTREEEILVECLRTNYRLGPLEVRALGLLDETCEQEILRVLIDWDGMLEMLEGLAAEAEQKKTAGRGGSTPDAPSGGPRQTGSPSTGSGGGA